MRSPPPAPPGPLAGGPSRCSTRGAPARARTTGTSRTRAGPPGRRCPARAAATDDRASGPALVQPGEGFLEEGVAVGVAAPLADVGQVGLVRLGALGRGRVLLVLAGREATPRAVPQLGHVRVGREGDPRLVPVGAPVGHPVPRGSLAALGLTHRTC